MSSEESTPSFPVIDRRGRTRSGLQVSNLTAEMNRLRQAGYALPNSPVQARVEAKKVAETVRTGSLEDTVRNVEAHMRRVRADNMRRLASTQHTASDVLLAMPKAREPLGTLKDKGIPIQIEDPEVLSEARRWARAYYATHDLVPLLIDIYARFPVTGLEFVCDDKKVEDFFSKMFLDDLDYENFLPNELGREYFISGEVTTLGHFDESLGTWADEEVLNPDYIRVSKSAFVSQERVQLMVKQLVENLRTPPGSGRETKSEQMQRNWEYQQLLSHHPEIIEAANQDDGLDISEALWSRIVNKISPWDLRGVPPLMRSFRTLLMEESLNAAQDAVADRLYSPFVLATLGIPDMGDGEPWIPTPDELAAVRDDMQAALMADFKLMVHHLGLKIESVFGRESVPRFDQDYDRIDMKLMQAWGIGQALIMGGTAAAGTYASSALNREVCELNMKDFQRKVVRHIKKRMEVVAEAQEFYAYERKGNLRVPIMRKIQRIDPETGESEVVEVPQLLIPQIRFRSLNLRDEQTERAFIADLKASGVPISDKTLAINQQIDFDLELQRQSEETVNKLVAQAQAMSKAKQIIDSMNATRPYEQQMPYPPDLIAYLQQTLMLRQQLAGTEMAEAQADMLEQQQQQMTPAGQLGLLPPTPPPGGAPAPGPAPAGQPGPPQEPLPPEQPVNRARPEISDEMRAGAPRMASKSRTGLRVAIGEADPGATWLQRGPSSYGHSATVDRAHVERAVRRRELTARHPVPRVRELVEDPAFYQMLNLGHLESQIRADFAEIAAGGAPESAQLLEEMLRQYEEITGDTPVWD